MSSKEQLRQHNRRLTNQVNNLKIEVSKLSKLNHKLLETNEDLDAKWTFAERRRYFWELWRTKY